MDSQGVLVHLRSVGEAAALKKSKFKIVENFLRKQLKYDGALFIYCGSGFSPTPDQKIGDLFDVSVRILMSNMYAPYDNLQFQCFHTASELVVYYGYQEAW
eukprot:gene607-1171_t